MFVESSGMTLKEWKPSLFYFIVPFGPAKSNGIFDDVLG